MIKDNVREIDPWEIDIAEFDVGEVDLGIGVLPSPLVPFIHALNEQVRIYPVLAG